MEEHFFSMLSPLEWGGKPPNEYVDSYRLEYDMSWTQVCYFNFSSCLCGG